MTEHALRPSDFSDLSDPPAPSDPSDLSDEHPHHLVLHRGPSPLAADRVRRLPRCQVADRLQELGALYATTSGSDPCEWDRLSRSFQRRLALDVRRPGFALLIAEGVTLTACAYGFPLRARLFAIREITVPHRVRKQSPHRDWNLARRMQRRLLSDHDHATGLTVVDHADTRTLTALRSWGWRDAAESRHGTQRSAARRVLLLDP